jgi:potassium-transporting ATPase potassium-binding subunit
VTAMVVLKVAIFFGVLLLAVKPLGGFMAKVYAGERTWLHVVMGPVERLFYRLAGVPTEGPGSEQTARQYTVAVLVFNCAGFLFLYALQRVQAVLPLNPQALAAVTPDLAFNTSVSFVSNTNWQSYAGETTLGYFVQMVGLTVQNFVSAATGMAVLVALVRGLTRKLSPTIGNFWIDLTRSTLYILLPLSIVVALILVTQGVVQTFDPYATTSLLQPLKDADGKSIVDQMIAVGPAASQVAIKQLGTNGGGFFNVNSAHPLENPTAISNFVECLSILLIPAALCYTFGKMVRDTRQGWAVLAAMLVIAVPLTLACAGFEVGNMEGKEVRFGTGESSIWAAWTTCASNGSVNAMHDSFTALGGMIPLFLMQMGEVVFGGVGSGLYGMLAFAIIAVFISGLMVGRTPEYLGKKIEAHEMKMASLVILFPAATVLLGTAIGVVSQAGRATVFNPGAHGFSEVLYAFTSAGNNNGSAFAGLGANNVFYNTALGVAMLFGRFPIIVAILAIAGSLAKKKLVPNGVGTLPTHGPIFVTLLVGVVLLVGALTFVPALALGPVVEHLLLHPAAAAQVTP